MFDSLRFSRLIITIMLLCLCAACSGTGEGEPQESTEESVISSPTPLTVSQPQATPGSIEPTVENIQMLRIWWPESLAPVDRPEVTSILTSQIESFVASEESAIEIDFRLKRSQDVGGIIETLRTGSTVAAEAMPDITLMRRDNLILAVRLGLIYPVEDQIPASIVGDLYDVLIDLGRVEGKLFGLPYTAMTSVSAYSELDAEAGQSPGQMDDFIQTNANWIFPAGNISTMGSILLAQYMDAGGRLPDSVSIPDTAALETVFSFYHNALSAGVVTDDTVGFSTLDGYQFGLPNQFIVIDTDRYFSLLAREEIVQIIHLPSASGEAIGTVNGWIWVVTTNDAHQQELALRFITWLMEPQRQLEFVKTLGTLPSRQSTLQNYTDADINTRVLDSILDRGIITPGDGTTGAFARAMVNGLLLILNGEGSIEDAIEVVQAQFNP